MNRGVFVFVKMAAVLLIAILCMGCQPGRAADEPAGMSAASDCYRVYFLGMTGTSEVASTWRYRVERQACGNDLKTWMLELPACAAVVEASPEPWETASPDLDYQMNGIKWQLGTDAQSEEFSVVLSGDLERGVTRAGVGGRDISISSMEGPACPGLASPSPTSPGVAGIPMARVTVQSANCREQPLGKAKKVALLYRNQEFEIIGRNEDPGNPWWYIKVPELEKNCWLWGKTAATNGNVDGLPVVR